MSNYSRDSFSMFIAREVSAGRCFPYDSVDMGNVAVSELWSNQKFQSELKRWGTCSDQFPQPILINAPTGSGKTTFVIKKLVPFALEQKKSVLLLCNRHALDYQNKEVLSEDMDSPVFSRRILKELSPYKNVITGTYHSLSRILTDLYYGRVQLPFPIGYIVLDEIHFLTSDALFNVWTKNIYSQILDRLPACQRFYLSATPEEVRDIIAYEEYVLYRRYVKPDNAQTYLPSLNNPVNAISEYQFQPDYSYINLHFWDSLSDLIPSMKTSESKWLIFVNNKSEGADFAETLKKKIDGEVIYVDANSRRKDEKIRRKINMMIEYEKFKQKILISTSLLDNGINFHDDKLENIVIDSVDPIQIKQMIGRKRRDKDKNQSVNVYIVKHTQERIQKYLQDARRKTRLLEHYRDNPSKFIKEEYPILSEVEHKLFEPVTNHYPNQFSLYVNEYAQYKLDCQIRNYEYLDGLLEMEGESAFEREVAGWFGIEDGNWTNVDDAEVEIKKQVVAAINKYKLKPAETNSEELKCLDKQLWDLVQPIVDKYKVKHDSESVGKGENIRNVLHALGLPYDIKKSKNMWEIMDKSIEMPPNQQSQ